MRIQPQVLRALADEALRVEALEAVVTEFQFAGYHVTLERTGGGGGASTRDDVTVWVTDVRGKE